MPYIQNVASDHWQAKPIKDLQKQSWSHQEQQQVEQPFEIGNWGHPSELQPSRQQWENDPNQSWHNDAGLHCVNHSILTFP